MNSFNFVEEEQEQEDQGSDGAGTVDQKKDNKPDISSITPNQITQTNFTRGLDLDNSPRPVQQLTSNQYLV